MNCMRKEIESRGAGSLLEIETQNDFDAAYFTALCWC
jgi:hypothetical protein